MNEPIAAKIESIQSWWRALPVKQRKTEYRIADIPVDGSTRTIGPALRELGWAYRGRKWHPPSRELTPDSHDVKFLRERVRLLERELGQAEKNDATAENIRRKIINLKHSVESTELPKWVIEPKVGPSSPGTPTLFLSDPHWGENVRSGQINGVNEYNLRIARKRLRKTVTSAVNLLSIISPALEYPGIVVPLGGDMISGNIHEELTATNEAGTMPVVVDLYGEMVSAITYLADSLGRVFLPCVTGNHGRDTRKIWAKDRHATSFDWLLYMFLAKHFESDKRITFLIPDGPDAHYRIYGHRYLLTHGDQFRGGDGMIGALGPIIRGDHRKRSRNTQIDMDYDTMLLGHWHQYVHLTRLIVNGTLKGYDEYAYSNNFPFEQPQQALWLTHPKHGITYRMPVYAGESQSVKQTEWVSWGKQ